LSPYLLALLVVGLGAVLSAAVIAGLRWHRARERTRRILAAITGIAADHRRDVMIADGNGGALHIDFLLLTPKGLVVVDVRDVSGNVFGSDQMSEWTVMSGPKRFTFPNPLGGLYDKVAAVKSHALEAPVDGRIAFTSGAMFPKGMPRSVAKVEELAVEFPVSSAEALTRGAAAYGAAWASVLTQLAPSPLRKPAPL
jgi:hypothetical protein